ncbi:MAG: FHA domain-containing protein [Planctomycetes bacterium]|nr:FHA domain-containing protein [Planctomycetota bacterium]
MAHDDALWCERGILVSVRDPDGNVKSVQLEKPFARIGSDYRSDVVLEDGDIPSRAVYLHATEEGIYYRRLVPREQGAASSGWLASGQFIRIGGYHVAASLPGQDEGSTPLPDLRRCRYPADESPRIRIQRAGLKGPAVEHTCRRPLTIVGRSRPSAVRLKRPLVSRCHCVLFWDQRDLWAIDLLSANGTLLDGSLIDCQRVLPDQVLQLGEIQITYLGVAEGGSARRMSDEPAVLGNAEATASLDPRAFPRMIESADKLGLDENCVVDVRRLQPAAAAVALDSVSLECAAEDESADLSSLALEMSMYTCEEQSASGHTVTGAPRAALLEECQIAEREAAGRAQAELTSRLQQLEQQRDELLQHVTAISSRLQELARQEQSHAIEADQWHTTVAAANQQISELQSSLETVRQESQLEADRLKRRCRQLKRQILRSQPAPPPAGQPLESDSPAMLAAVLATVESVGNSLSANPPPLLDCGPVIATEPEELCLAPIEGDAWEYGLTEERPEPLQPAVAPDSCLEVAEEPKEIDPAPVLDDSVERGLIIAEAEDAHPDPLVEEEDEEQVEVEYVSGTAELTPPDEVRSHSRRSDSGVPLTGTMEFPLAVARAQKTCNAEAGEKGLVSRFIVSHIERETEYQRSSLLLVIVAGSVAALIMVAAAAWFWQGTLLPGS